MTIRSPNLRFLNFIVTVAPPYLTRPEGQTRSGDANQFYHIYIFEYCRNKCFIIISVKDGPPFCQLTLSFNMACMPFQHYHLQNIIRVHFHKYIKYFLPMKIYTFLVSLQKGSNSVMGGNVCMRWNVYLYSARFNDDSELYGLCSCP